MLIDTSILKATADMVNIICSEVTVVPDENGWEIKVIDPAHVAMLRLRLKPEAFGGTYEVNEQFTIDMEKFASVLKDMGTQTEVTIDGQERVVMKSEGTTRRFTQKVAVDAPSQFPADRLPMDNFAIFDPAELKARMASLCSIDQIVRVGLNDSMIVFKSVTDDEDMTVVFPMEKCKALAGTATASYPSSYVGDVFKAVPKGLALQVVLSTDFPILLKFTGDMFTAEYVIAPQVESD